jgi:hypothetical protein
MYRNQCLRRYGRVYVCEGISRDQGFFFSWSGVRLSPLGTSATNWPIVPAPDDRWWWVWNNWWNCNWHGRPKYSEQTCRSANLSSTNPTLYDLGSNPGRRGGKPATNRLSYGTALIYCSGPVVLPKRLTYEAYDRFLANDLPVLSETVPLHQQHMWFVHTWCGIISFYSHCQTTLEPDLRWTVDRSRRPSQPLCMIPWS